jgi:hypothetical protein
LDLLIRVRQCSTKDPLTTLFRRALEVSATPLILLRADAGEVIRAFGNFVVAGNLVVDAVVSPDPDSVRSGGGARRSRASR